MIKVSIIVPVYNNEKNIVDCLLSIKEQSYKNIEVVCVDDGSHDSSGDKIKEISEGDSRFKYLYINNSGASYARLLGFNNSCGDYIVFVDSDDILDKYAIEKLLSTALKKNSSLVVGGYRCIGDENTEPYKFEKEQLTSEEFSIRLIKNTLPCSLWGKIYKRDILFDNVLDVDRSIKIGEDLLINLSVSCSIRTIIIIDDIVYNYRITKNSLSKSTKRKLSEILKFQGIISNNIENQGLDPIYSEYYKSSSLVLCLFMNELSDEDSFNAVKILKRIDFCKVRILFSCKLYILYKLIVHNIKIWKFRGLALFVKKIVRR